MLDGLRQGLASVVEPGVFFDALRNSGLDFFTGVPDSLLKDFCAYVSDHAAADRHIIAANEGGAVALAAGYHMATGRLALVYMQNSGQGNAMNPLTSLTDPEVCGIPMILLVGWRGEPGTVDEPQHVKQGAVTLDVFDALRIGYSVLPRDTGEALQSVSTAIARATATSAPVALVARADTFASYRLVKDTRTSFELNREGALRLIVQSLDPDAIVVGTTGKTSRELFEAREAFAQPHTADFRTVGCMGHASHIALGIALAQPARPVYCLDGDGAVLMHMGALAILGSQRTSNLKHIVLNNGAHDSVGGQPTVGFEIDIPAIATACGYRAALTARTRQEVVGAIEALRQAEGPALLEVKVNKGARTNLGRPTTSPAVNKRELMANLGA
jgi:phosphonopyruvate decarboxylase